MKWLIVFQMGSKVIITIFVSEIHCKTREKNKSKKNAKLFAT